ncbi:uncharacterized protein LOC143630354 [Bidens hawaiensis]|uniref:uncharacterized protein LOC143630354 n=1 Tax=Bidens hawaiensis TaxID=980011 RepID=UPI00404B779D
MSSESSPLPIHLCFFLIILFMFISFSWYSTYESMFEGLFNNLTGFHCFTSALTSVLQLISIFDTTGRSPFFVPVDGDSPTGSVPWGVGLVLVLLFLLLSYQLDLCDRWREKRDAAADRWREKGVAGGGRGEAAGVWRVAGGGGS